ncbi:MAG: hypothetical protein AB7O96_10680 [Pseudobdellovibrionaceae bacterium]
MTFFKKESSWVSAVLAFGLIVFAVLYFQNFEYLLRGVHKIRQADTLFTGYSYCFEGTEFLKPKVANRENTSGVSIGEFPLFSYLISIPCKMTGQWSETFPRYFSIFIFLLNGLLWGAWIKKRNPQILFSSWLIFFFFCSLQLLHLSIPLPDGLALLFMGGALFLWEEKGMHQTYFWISGLFLFGVGFLMRPYLFPLVFLYWDKKTWTAALALCGALYFFWYKYWIFKYSEVSYYLTRVVNPEDLVPQIPGLILPIIEISIIEMMNYVGLFLILFFVKDFKKEIAIWALVCIMVIGARGKHFINHNYYLLAGSLVISIVMTLAWNKIKNRCRTGILLLFVLIGIGLNQHLWKAPKEKWQIDLERMANEKVPKDAKVASYIGVSPQWLYLSKRTGWMFKPEKYTDQCPEGAAWALILKDELPEFIPCKAQ